jgi:hypothetical protein
VIVNNSKGYDRFGGSGASQGDVQSGLECITPASSLLPLTYLLQTLILVTLNT